MQYGTNSYQMGDSYDNDPAPDDLDLAPDDDVVVSAAATAPITKAHAGQAKVELERMRSSLKQWLKFRGMNDEIAAGRGAKLPSPVLKKPGSKLPSPQVMASKLGAQRGSTEAKLASRLHTLLSEVFDGSTLPNPDIAKNPDAAVELAKIAIAGKLPGETGPHAQGFIWMWPLVIVVGAVAIVIMSAIRSSADVAKEKEQIECIKAGKCTDTGFWMKVGAIGVVGWLVWDKAGLGARVTGAFRRGRGA